MQVLSRGFLRYTMLTNPKQNKVGIIQARSELSQSPAQHVRNIVGSFILHSFSHPVGCEWLGVETGWNQFETAQTFEPTTPNISFIPYLPKGCVTMLDPFAQLFQN